MDVVADINHLTGHDEAAQAAKALLAHYGARMRLTPQAVRRLACHATLRFVLHDHGQLLGISHPTGDIPAPTRRAVTARDQGCRFPGCRAPVHFCDLHHIRFRSDGGSHHPDNLVVLCRRHHTAVHEGGWKLDMAADATVTVTRGRHQATSRPPLHQDRRPPPRQGRRHRRPRSP